VFVDALAEDIYVSPIAHYEFKDADNPGKDSSGNFDLSVLGTVASGSSLSAGKGVYFDGASKLYATTDSTGRDFSDYLYDFTVSFWIYNDGWADDTYYSTVLSTGLYGVEKGICFKTCYMGYHHICAISKNGVYSDEGGALWQTWKERSTWHHVVYSVSNSTGSVAVYFDGNNFYNGEYSVPMENLQDVFSLGAGSYNSGSNSFYTGFVDDVRVYDFSASSGNVASLYAGNMIEKSEVSESVASITSSSMPEANASEESDDSGIREALSGKSVTLTLSTGGEVVTDNIVWGKVDRSNEGYALVSGTCLQNGISNYKGTIVGKVNLLESVYALPFAWYRFDDPANWGKDSMGNMDMNTIGTISAASEGGISLTGSNGLYTPVIRGGLDYVDKLTEITVSFRAKRTDGSLGSARIVSHGFDGSSVGFAVIVDDRVRFPVANTQGASDNAWWDNSLEMSGLDSWRTYTLSISKSVGRMYIDGSLISTFIPKTDTELSFMIDYFAFAVGGSVPQNNTSFVNQGFVGDFKDLRIYDFALSSSEVANVYNDTEMNASGIVISNEKETISSYEVVNAQNTKIDCAMKYVGSTANSIFKSVSVSQSQANDDDYTAYIGKVKLTTNFDSVKYADVWWYKCDDNAIYGMLQNSEATNASGITVTLPLRLAVTYVVDGVADGALTQGYAKGEQSVAPTSPEKAGYRFDYWTLNGVEYVFGTAVTEPMELVAVFSEVSRLNVSLNESIFYGVWEANPESDRLA
ncbi:MAG: LamG-like jellyroll fold domain-containing protein, partial [Christensenellales bacterium]